MSNNEENNSPKLRLTPKVEESLIKKQYGVYNHSAVQICSWNKKALTGKGVCYKERFYGIRCHSCMEMAPTVMWCQQNCTFCWRPMEYMKNLTIKKEEVDEPKEIIENLILKRQKLMNGFGGHNDLNKEKFKDAQIPTHYSISLSGEPTMYPKLPEMVEYLKKLERTETIFVVSNGQEPEYFEKLKGNLQYQPTQLYISLDASTPEIFDKVNKSLYKDGWERLNQSLENMSKINCRKVIRMTQIKGLNDNESDLKGYKELIEKSKADIIEVKAYMYLGLSRNRHTRDQMPEWEDVQEFAKKICDYLGNYEIEGEMNNSLILLLRRKDSPYTLKIEKFENHN
ncbi:MAG: 4-demethylwyosine synthase TYW1 [Candidatus Woesearchaeota archaeon]|jgi:tRNA wybutosine-synthesizing protein 1|nr:4-demethylwyosine synthase TYW1 [Candidatus Woesearchaeota archaeon]